MTKSTSQLQRQQVSACTRAHERTNSTHSIIIIIIIIIVIIIIIIIIINITHSTNSRCQVSASLTSSVSLGHEEKGGLRTHVTKQCVTHTRHSSPVHVHNDPRRNVALQPLHLLQEKLHLRPLRVLAVQHNQ
jgi:hypothetical protein